MYMNCCCFHHKSAITGMIFEIRSTHVCLHLHVFIFIPTLILILIWVWANCRTVLYHYKLCSRCIAHELINKGMVQTDTQVEGWSNWSRHLYQSVWKIDFITSRKSTKWTSSYINAHAGTCTGQFHLIGIPPAGRPMQLIPYTQLIWPFNLQGCSYFSNFVPQI